MSVILHTHTAGVSGEVTGQPDEVNNEERIKLQALADDITRRIRHTFFHDETETNDDNIEFNKSMVLAVMALHRSARDYLKTIIGKPPHPEPHFTHYNPIKDLMNAGFIIKSGLLYRATPEALHASRISDILNAIYDNFLTDVSLPESEISIEEGSIALFSVLGEIARRQLEQARKELIDSDCCPDLRRFLSHFHKVCSYAALNRYLSTDLPSINFCPHCGAKVPETTEVASALQAKHNVLVNKVNHYYGAILQRQATALELKEQEKYADQ